MTASQLLAQLAKATWMPLPTFEDGPILIEDNPGMFDNAIAAELFDGDLLAIVHGMTITVIGGHHDAIYTLAPHGKCIADPDNL